MTTLQSVSEEIAQQVLGDKLQSQEQKGAENADTDNNAQEEEQAGNKANDERKGASSEQSTDQGGETDGANTKKEEEEDKKETENEKKENDKDEDSDEDEDQLEKVASKRLQERFRKINAEKNQYKKELEELKAKQQNKQANGETEESGSEEETEEEEENRRIEERMAKLGYMKKSDWEKAQEDEKLKAGEVKQIEKELKQLADEFPDVYDRKTVLGYMKDKGVTDARAAFFATSYGKLQSKEKQDERNVGYQGMAGKASGNVVSTGDSIQVGQPPQKSLQSEAQRIAKSIFNQT